MRIGKNPETGDAKDGRLVYVVLSIGDFPGMVNELFCLALESLRIPRHLAQAHPQRGQGEAEDRPRV